VHKIQLVQYLCIVAIALLFGKFSSVSFGQQNIVDPNQGGYWIAYIGDNKLNKHIGIHSEVQLRNYFVNETVETLVLRTGINVYIKPYAMATAGYGYIHSKPSEDYLHASEVSEHRTWQQLILRQKSHAIFMEHRYRLEQRFLENLTSGTSRVDHRIRYRFQMLLPLYSITPHLRHFFVALNDELMINFSNDPTRLFDRNRFFAGIGFQVSPKLNFQLGYMNQFAQVGWKTNAHIDHILQFGISYNMDDLMQTFLKKPEK